MNLLDSGNSIPGKKMIMMKHRDTAYFNTESLIRFQEEIAKRKNIIYTDVDFHIGWKNHNVDYNRLFEITQGLKIKKGYKLQYLRYGYELPGTIAKVASKTYIFGLPEDIDCAIPDVESTATFSEIKPKEAVHLYETIEGDKSPWSYIEASILYRQLKNNVFLYPTNDESNLVDKYAKSGKLTWLCMPADWQAVVTCYSGIVFTHFYTYNEIYNVSVYKNLDVYYGTVDDIFGKIYGNYCVEMEKSQIAIGETGVMIN